MKNSNPLGLGFIPDLRSKFPLGKCNISSLTMKENGIIKDEWYQFVLSTSDNVTCGDIYVQCYNLTFPDIYQTESRNIHGPVSIYSRDLPSISQIPWTISKIIHIPKNTFPPCFHITIYCTIEDCATNSDSLQDLSFSQDYEILKKCLIDVPVRSNMKYQFQLSNYKYILSIDTVNISSGQTNDFSVIVSETTISIFPTMTPTFRYWMDFPCPNSYLSFISSSISQSNASPFICIEGDPITLTDILYHFCTKHTKHSLFILSIASLISQDDIIDKTFIPTTKLRNILESRIEPQLKMLAASEMESKENVFILCLTMPTMVYSSTDDPLDSRIYTELATWFNAFKHNPLIPNGLIKILFITFSLDQHSITFQRRFIQDSSLFSFDKLGPLSNNDRCDIIKNFHLEFPSLSLTKATINLSMPRLLLLLYRLKSIDSLSLDPYHVFNHCIAFLGLSNESTTSIGISVEKKLDWILSHNEDSTQMEWNDVGGYQDIKNLLIQSICWPLQYPKTFDRLGLNSPRGILLHGPPGCSKTSIARHVAQQWYHVEFLLVRASELYSCYVGESEQYVRALFKHARSKSPCILFFDELDALVGKRSLDDSSASKDNVQERILSSLLNEMDGIESLDRGILIMGATNRLDRIDSALLRPGRFDKLVHVPLPDHISRKEILDIHTRSMPFDCNSIKTDIIESIAKATNGLSGADLANICQEAGMIALREGLNVMNKSHFDNALEKCMYRSEI